MQTARGSSFLVWAVLLGTRKLTGMTEGKKQRKKKREREREREKKKGILAATGVTWKSVTTK